MDVIFLIETLEDPTLHLQSLSLSLSFSLSKTGATFFDGCRFLKIDKADEGGVYIYPGVIQSLVLVLRRLLLIRFKVLGKRKPVGIKGPLYSTREKCTGQSRI